MSDLDIKHLCWYMSQIYVVIELSITHNKLTGNVFIAPSFDSRMESSSGHFTRTVNTESLCIIRVLGLMMT